MKLPKTLFYILLTCLLISLDVNASGQGEPFDYFNPANHTLLKDMELFHLTQARTKIKQRDFLHAWGDLSYVLHYFPNHPIALNLLGEVALENKKHSELIKYYERALALFPSSASRLQYGDSLLKLSKVKAARQQYLIALQLKPSSKEAQKKLQALDNQINNSKKD